MSTVQFRISDFGFRISHPDRCGGPGKRLYNIEIGRRIFGDATPANRLERKN